MTEDSIHAMLRAEIRTLHGVLTDLLREVSTLRQEHRQRRMERDAILQAIRPKRRSTARTKLH
jgi:uncharacterized protein (UPF0335 family)